MRPLITALAAALLAACAVGPEHVRPSMAVPETFEGSDVPDATAATANAAVGTAATAVADTAFWRAFGDPQLNALVEDTLVANHDLRIALARFDRANALLRGRRFDRLPTIDASGTAASNRASADQVPGVPRDARDTDSFDIGIGASWELDLFGRVRRSVEAGRADVAASAEDLRALQVAIVGEVATAYLDLRGLQERLRVATENAGNQQQTLALVQARREAGQDSGFDSARASAQAASTSARIPVLEAEIAVATHRIAVLTGRTPEALRAQLTAPRALPAVPRSIDPGTPADLLRVRPDVAAAEHRLHSATARVGVATADLFPRLTLGGLIGSQAGDIDALFGRDSETRLVALGIDWSFLDIGRVRARIAAADADAEMELARYQQTVLRALEDTGNALVRFNRAHDADVELERAARDSAHAAQLARMRFDAGATGLLDVLDAERSQLQAEDAFAAGRTRTATDAVALYRALAGGWPQTLPPRETAGVR
ncbi:efflux transporter outer membrane subunit [Luteimonas sp. 100069]|uniref:efflux transporter outer membrane subunit n=1 Tax=Luteimonas sp. 100069 TaxID=2006109 RepID=UPI000F4FE089|nr:efflux transporter outer membrane subunit [Luteimonas sp. 100069]RPD85271.1 efflux transporter outer membrane subunit [Luteimonas sp. 100069]